MEAAFDATPDLRDATPDVSPGIQTPDLNTPDVSPEIRLDRIWTHDGQSMLQLFKPEEESTFFTAYVNFVITEM